MMKDVARENLFKILNSTGNLEITEEQLEASLPDWGMDSITLFSL